MKKRREKGQIKKYQLCLCRERVDQLYILDSDSTDYTPCKEEGENCVQETLQKLQNSGMIISE